MAEAIGNLAVVITATDRATATINRVDAGLSHLPATAGRLQSAFSRIGDMPGLSRLRTGLSYVRSEASAVGRTLATAAVPLAGGGLAAGAAAVTSQFMSMGAELQGGARRLGMGVGDLHAFRNAVTLMGRDAGEAQEGMIGLDRALYDAGRGQNPALAGLMTRFKSDLGPMRDANGQITRATAMAPRLFDLLRQLRNAPNEQEQVASAAGAEWMAPLARRYGSFAEMLREGRRLGVFSDDQVRQAKQMGDEWSRLQMMGQSLNTLVGGALAPSLGRGVQRMTAWTEANQTWLRTSTDERMQQIARNAGTSADVIDRAVRSTIGWEKATDLLSIALGVRLLGALTGVRASALLLGATRLPPWALALLGIGGLAAGNIALDRGGLLADARRSADDRATGRTGWMIGGRPASEFWDRIRGRNMPDPRAGGFPTGSARRQANDDAPDRGGDAVTSRHRDAFDYFRRQGWSDVAAAGIVGNLHHESNVRHDGPNGDGGMSKGLAQWNRERLDAFRAFAGVDIAQSTREQQLAFIQHELTSGRDVGARRAGLMLRGARTAQEAGEAFSLNFERPAGREGEARSRGRTAEAMLPQLRGGPQAPQPAPQGAAPPVPRDGFPAPQPAAPMPVPQGTPMSQRGDGGSGVVKVIFENAPANTRATVSSTGGLRLEPPEMRSTMPSMGV